MRAPVQSILRVDTIHEPDAPSRTDVENADIPELANSIARVGLLEPIGVRQIPETETYRLVYGHRRLRAVKHLGWYTIPALILDPDVSELEARQAENSQRVQLTPVEEAKELRRYAEAGEPLTSIAARVSRSTTWVHQRLRLLRYQDNVLDAIHRHGLPLTVADLLAQIEHDGYRQYMLDEAVANGASATTAAVWLAHYKTEQARLEHNITTVEEIAAKRGDYTILAPCEYCGVPAELQKQRSWRLCLHCSDGLVRAKTTRIQEEISHVRA